MGYSGNMLWPGEMRGTGLGLGNPMTGAQNAGLNPAQIGIQNSSWNNMPFMVTTTSPPRLYSLGGFDGRKIRLHSKKNTPMALADQLLTRKVRTKSK